MSLIAPKTDEEILQEYHRFLRDETDDMGLEKSWEKRQAKARYDSLYKEYCVGDFSRTDTGEIGLRWRTKNEVLSGKGQYSCGNLACKETTGLKNYEVNFMYLEDDQKKNALVKVCLCTGCKEVLPERKTRRSPK